MAGKKLPWGKAYQCEKCLGPLRPHDGPWDVLHCPECQRSVDLWHDPEPKIIDVDFEILPYKPELVILKV